MPFLQTLSSGLLLPSLVFFAIYAFPSYVFFDITLFKLASLWAGLFFIFLWDSFLRFNDCSLPRKLWWILSLPLIGSLPGLLWHENQYNYYLSYQLGQHLLILLWVGLLHQRLIDRKNHKPLLFLLTAVTFYVSLWLLLEKSGVPGPTASSISFGRGVTTFGNINYLASFLSLAIPFLGLIALRQGLRRRQISRFELCLLLVLVVSILTLMVTETRTAIFATLITLALGAIFSLKRFIFPRSQNWFFYSLWATIFIFAFSLIFIVPGLPERFAQLASAKTWDTRFVIWQTAWQAIKEAPWMGYGPGSFYNIFFEFIAPDSRLYFAERSFKHAHNIILEWLVRGGLLGLLGGLTLSSLVLWQIKTVYKKATETLDQDISYAAFWAFMAFAIHSCFSLAQQKIGVQLLAVTIITLLFSLTPVKRQKKSGWQRLLLLCFLLSAGQFLYPWVHSFYQYREILKQPADINRLQQLEKLLGESHNVHALNFIAYEQISAGRFSELEKTLLNLQKSIPHYRRIDFLNAARLYLKGQLPQSRNAAESFQSRDLYEMGNIQLLTRIAIVQKDPDLLLLQMQRLLEHLIVWNHIDDISDPKLLKFQINPTQKPSFLITKQNASLLFSVSPQWIDRLFVEIRPLLLGKNVSAQDRAQLYQVFLKDILNNAYFENRARKPDLQPKVDQVRRDWLTLEQKRQRDLMQLQETLPIKPSEMDSFKQKTIIIQSRDRLKKQPLERYLMRHSNWETYQSRKQISDTLIKWILSLSFPHHDFIKQGL